jgi:hypothetical protein
MFSDRRKTPHLQQTDWQGYRLAPLVGDRGAGNASSVLALVAILRFTQSSSRFILLLLLFGAYLWPKKNLHRLLKVLSRLYSFSVFWFHLVPLWLDF